MTTTFGPSGRYATARRAYSEDQPRDAHGRFGEGGSTGALPANLGWASADSIAQYPTDLEPSSSAPEDWQAEIASTGVAWELDPGPLSQDGRDNWEEIGRGVFAAVEQLTEQYPDVMRSIDHIEWRPALPDEATAQAGRFPDTTLRIQLSETDIGQSEADRQDGYAIVMHEFGHIAMAYATGGVTASGEGNPMSTVNLLHPSEYSMENETEHAAELFAAGHLGQFEAGSPEQAWFERLTGALTIPSGQLAPRTLNLGPRAAAPTVDGDVAVDTFDSETVGDIWKRTIRQAAARVAYSEDQPRDAHGRFGEGGGDDPQDRWDRGSHMVEQLMVTFPNADVTIDADTEEEIRSKDFGEDVLTVLGGIVTGAQSLAAEYPDVAATLEAFTVGEGQLSGAIGESLSAGAVEKYKMDEGPYIALNIAEGLIDSESRAPGEAIGFDVMGTGTGPPDAEIYGTMLARLGEAMMTHEFGHLVDNEGRHGYAAWVAQSPEEAEHVSVYASTNENDYFAEAFTAQRMGFEDRLTDDDRDMLRSAGVDVPLTVVAAASTGSPHGDTFVGSIVWEVAYGQTLPRVVAARRAYSEDQARDWHGRFGEGAGGPGEKQPKADRSPGTLTKKGVVVNDGKTVKPGDAVRVRYEVGQFERFMTTGTGKIVDRGDGVKIGIKFDRDGRVGYFNPEDVFKGARGAGTSGKVEDYLFNGIKYGLDDLINVASQVFGQPPDKIDALGGIDLSGIGDLGRAFGGAVGPLFGPQARRAYTEDQPRDWHGRFGESTGEGRVLDGGRYSTSYAARYEPPPGTRKGDTVLYTTATGTTAVWHAFGDPKDGLGYIGMLRPDGEGVHAAGWRIEPRTFPSTEAAARYLVDAPRLPHGDLRLKPGAEDALKHTFAPGPYAKSRETAVDVFVAAAPEQPWYAGTVHRTDDGALVASGVKIPVEYFRPDEMNAAADYLVDAYMANLASPRAAAVYSWPGTPTVRVAYSPDQPRDEHGRFGEGAGGTVTRDEMQQKLTAWANSLPHVPGTMFTVMPQAALDQAKTTGALSHEGGVRGFWVTNNANAEYVHGPGDVMVALRVAPNEFLGGGHGGDFRITNGVPLDRLVGTYRVRDTVSDPMWPTRAAMSAWLAYTEDQPRDWHGRFGEGGGSTVTRDPAEAGAQVAAIATSEKWGQLEYPNPHAPADWGQTTNPDWGHASNASYAALEHAGYNPDGIENVVHGWGYGGAVGLFRDVASGQEDAYLIGSKTIDDINSERIGSVKDVLEIARSTEIDAPLYRSMGIGNDNELLNDLLKPGTTIPGEPPSSWSRDEEVARIFGGTQTGVSVNMTMAPGARGLDIATLGVDEYAWQQEVIVPADSYRVVSRELVTNDFDTVKAINVTVEPVYTQPARSGAASAAGEDLFGLTFAQWGLANGKIDPASIPARYRPAHGASAVTTVAPMRAYSPDQPRDAHGRFGEGDGGTATSPVADSIGTIFARIAAPDEGGTIDLVTGQSPTGGYMVGREGAAQAVPLAEFTASRDAAVQTVMGYVRDHADLFDQPGAMLGLWHNPETGNVVLDVSENITDRAAAIAAGAANDQISIYDVTNGQLIPTGGTGGGQAAVRQPRARSAAQAGQRHDRRGTSGVRRAGSQRDLAVRIKRARRLVERLAHIRRDTVRDLRAAAEIAFAEALRQAGVRVITKMHNRQGSAAARTVASAYENRQSLAPFFAALGVTESDLLAGSFGTYQAQAEDWLRQYRQQQRSEVADSGLDPDDVITESHASEVAAVAFIVAALQAIARQRLLAGADPTQVPGEVSGVIPPQIIIRAMRIADGLAVPQFAASPDIMPEVLALDTESLIDRIASALRQNVLDDLHGELRARETDAAAQADLDTAAGQLNVDDLSAAIEDLGNTPTTEYVWVHGFYGEPTTDFIPHADLDGESFTGDQVESDDRLVNDGDWPDGDFYYPGDHLGCSCELVAQVPTGTEALADLIA